MNHSFNVTHTCLFETRIDYHEFAEAREEMAAEKRGYRKPTLSDSSDDEDRLPVLSEDEEAEDDDDDDN